jgi:hypothetical protein
MFSCKVFPAPILHGRHCRRIGCFRIACPSYPCDLEERLNILHRLNELGEKNIDDLSIVNALEKTNVLMRETDRAGVA